MKSYWRPIVQTGASRPAEALTLADGWAWFDRVEKIQRGGTREVVSLDQLPETALDALTRARRPVAGVTMSRPRIMGIVNVTPDSFSDGGQFATSADASVFGKGMVDQGADFLDVGGESTRPGAEVVGQEEEIARVQKVITELADLAPVSVDTRKSAVGRAALDAGAVIINDVSALEYDPDLGRVAAAENVPICLMHAQGVPETMQDDPRYEDVLLDVYDGLEDAIARAQSVGIQRDNIIVDPGIGFGKTLEHNLALLRDISLFHGFGVPVLLGASRKRFIGSITGNGRSAKSGRFGCCCPNGDRARGSDCARP